MNIHLRKWVVGYVVSRTDEAVTNQNQSDETVSPNINRTDAERYENIEITYYVLEGFIL